jgi:hypothetical protein
VGTCSPVVSTLIHLSTEQYLLTITVSAYFRSLTDSQMYTELHLDKQVEGYMDRTPYIAFLLLDGVRLSLCGTVPLTGIHLPDHKLVWVDIDQRWNETFTGKPKDSENKFVLLPLYPAQIPHGLNRVRNWTSAVRVLQLIAWSMARRPYSCHFRFLASWTDRGRRRINSPRAGVAVSSAWLQTGRPGFDPGRGKGVLR